MALRSNASTTSLMNDARSPSGNHSRMSGGNNNRWSCEYGRKRWVMSHTLLARAPLTQHFQSDRLLAEAEASAGENDAGLQRLDDALAESEHPERWYEAEMHRIRGEILLRRVPPDTAAAEQ